IEEARGLVLDPRRIAGTPSVPVADLAESPPASARTPEAVAATETALDALRNVEQGIRQWPKAGDHGIAVLAETYADDRGWTGHAERLRAAADSVQPAPGLGVAKAIDAALAVKRQLAAIEAVYADIQSHRQRIEVLGKEIAERLGRHVLDETRGCESLEALKAKLGGLAKLAGQLAASAEPVRTHKDRIAQIAGQGFAQRFLECARPRLENAEDLQSLPARLKLVKGLAPGIESRLEAVKAHHDAILDLGDRPLADKLWECALAETAGAGTLMALNERLEGVKTVAPKIAAHRKAVAQHQQAIIGLGMATLERHGRHMARRIAEAEDMASLLEAVERSAELIARVADRWKAIRKLQETIVASGDPILARFATYPPARVNAENNIATLPDTLDEIHATAQQLAQLVERDWKTGRIDRERFTRESPVHRNFQGKVTDQTLEDWRTQVAHYYRLDAAADPRQPQALWDEPLRDMRWRIAFLSESDDPAKRQKGKRHARELADLEARLAELRKLPWIKDHQARITKAAEALRKDMDALAAQLKDVIEPPAAWLDRIRGLDRIADSQAVNRAWRKRRDDLVTERVTPQALEGFRQVYTRLWRNVRTLRQFLAGLDDPEALPRGLPEALAKQPDSELLEAAAQAVRDRREQAIQAAIDAISWGDNKVPATPLAEFKQGEAWRKAVAAYVGWRKDAARLIADFRAIETALDAGYLLDDKPATLPGSPAQLYARWRDHELLDTLREALQPVLERLADLEAVAKMPRDKLVERLRRGGRPEAVLAAWLRLGPRDDWPGTVAELKLELAARDTLRQAVETIAKKDADRARWLAGRLDREGPRRWERAFNLLARTADDGLRDEGLAAALQSLRAFGVQVDHLEPSTRLRIHLYDLRDKAAALPDDAPRGQVAALINGFLERTASLPRVADWKPAADLLRQLQEIRDQKADDRPSAGLQKSGPMASPLAAQWEAKVRDDGTAADYTWAARKQGLRFVRVEPAGGAAKPAYVATTEVSVALFTDVLDAADRWVEAAGLLRAYDPNVDDRKGPRVWEWKRGDRTGIQSPQRWTARESGHSRYYADGLKLGTPEGHHPMQHVSAAAALYFAGLLGCRLPTAAEWRGAFEAHGRGPRPNLRDASWSRQLAYLKAKSAGHFRPVVPDEGIFTPPDVPCKRGKDAVAVTTEDDGALWFDPVGEPDVFRHLVGNVAEFVFERPEQFDERARSRPGLKAAGVLAFVKEHAEALRVVGASALSPPVLWDGKDKPFHRAWPVGDADSRNGYSDVGFRLAFTAPREEPAARLKRMLRGAGYLAGKGQ
ncbi:MAG: SUMF1/EgtB/PvdO family nonheme iron enzyme, partial [Planctomycetota bacterium]